MASTEQQLRKFLADNFLFGREVSFSDEDSFIEKGLIDSTGVLELIAFLEKEFGIHIEEEEIIPDNLDSIRRISKFLQAKLDGTARRQP